MVLCNHKENREPKKGGKVVYMMTNEVAQELLKSYGYDDYTITNLYEDSFKAVRTNEWVKSELNVSYFPWSETTSFVTHVIERYK